MLNKKIISVLFCALLFFLSVGLASAQISDDGVLSSETPDGAVNSYEKENFNDLEIIINNSQDNSTINLNSDYKYDGLDNFTGIVIDKNNLTINGNGHVIDANSENNSVRIFNITGSNVTLKNLIFTNANSNSFLNGGAIYNTGAYLSVVNSTFINNSANFYGGAIYNYASKLSVADSTFINNSVTRYGGAIYNANSMSSVVNSIFIGNTGGFYGGAINNYGSNFSVVDSIFINNSAKNGGAIRGYGNYLSILRSIFINNTGEFYGGAIRNYGDYSSVVESKFVNSSSKRGGAIYNYGVGSAIKNSSFDSNYASFDGGAIYNDGANVSVMNSSFRNNSATHYGGVIYNEAVGVSVVASSFVDNIASNGSAIYTIGLINASDNWWGDNPDWSNLFIVIIPTYLEASDLNIFYHDGSKFTAQLLDLDKNTIANVSVSITINNVTYNRTTDANGFVYLNINLDSGNYPVFVKFNGNDTYYESHIYKTVFVNSTIIANDIVKMYGNGTNFVANFLNVGGKPLANTNISFNINGVFYTKSTDDNGSVGLNINLRPGNYILSAYNNVTGEVKGFNITVNSLIESSDLSKYYKNASQFIAKVYDKDGLLAINKTVEFNINGVLYKRTTDENGSVKLNINLRPGNYTISTTYGGLSIGNNICVLPTLIAEDLTMNYLDNSKFNVTILDGQGKAFSNQVVEFNINGVVYNKTTNDVGLASLNINLIAGKYIITSSYGDYSTSNKITITE